MARRIPFFVVDSFTDTPFAGNPAGVFFDDAAALSADEMRLLCREVSLESAFVLPTENRDADFRLRYFTGAMEVPLCGHATLAALTVMARSGLVGREAERRVATNVGILTVRLAPLGDGVAVTLFQNRPDFGPPLEGEQSTEVESALGFAPSPNLPVQRVSTGTPWLLVPVVDRATVDMTPTRFDRIEAVSRTHETFGIYVFTVEQSDTGISTWGRCYAPLAGLNEDPVTGSGSGALGAYLFAHRLLGDSDSFRVQQGYAGGRGGTAHVAVSDQQIAVTGQAVVVAEGAFTLP